MSAIAADRVSKHWSTARGDVRAVDDVTFEFAPGTLNVLLGPSGCGKSTTLRLIAGLETADGGRIKIAGRDVTRLPPAKRSIAMVFQSYALFPHLTVAENIEFGLAVRKVPAAERAKRLARVADLLGLSTLLARKPSQLSGGQQQRVALGRAIIAEAPVCLMDEPLSNLDAQLRAEMRLEIRALQRKLGITMVYVTHDQVEAMSMADRVVLLNAGKVEQNGTPVDFYEAPANAAVARFIGTPLITVAAPGDARRCRDRRHRRSRDASRGTFRGARLAFVPSTSRSRTNVEFARRSRALSIWVAIRCSRAASAPSAWRCARPGPPASRAAIGRGFRGPPARSIISTLRVRDANCRAVNRRPQCSPKTAFASSPGRKSCCSCTPGVLPQASLPRSFRYARSRRRRPRSRSSIRSPSGDRSRRSSTASPRSSKRRIRTSS
jgi:sn-glycerol 3-phosphate transport system ATP-binding protein